MSDTDTDRRQSPAAILKQIPDVWKVITVMVAIAAAAIGGSRWVDAQMKKPGIELGGRIEKLEQRMAVVERDKAPLADLARFDDLDRLMDETCDLRVQLQKMEFKALKGAYDELLRTMDSAKDLYLKLNRELTEAELAQVTEISKRRSDIATKRETAEKEIAALDAKVLANRGCDG